MFIFLPMTFRKRSRERDLSREREGRGIWYVARHVVPGADTGLWLWLGHGRQSSSRIGNCFRCLGQRSVAESRSCTERQDGHARDPIRFEASTNLAKVASLYRLDPCLRCVQIGRCSSVRVSACVADFVRRAARRLDHNAAPWESL